MPAEYIHCAAGKGAQLGEHREGQPVDGPLMASSGYAQVGQPAVSGRSEQDPYLLVWSRLPLSALDPYRISATVLEKAKFCRQQALITSMIR
jgi:hypothetical protein